MPSDAGRSLAERNCLAALTGFLDEAAKTYCRLPPEGIDFRTLRLLRHEPVQLLLASDHLKRLLDAGSGQEWLEKQMPQGLVEAVAAAMSAAAVEHLRTRMSDGPAACQPMAASLLHAADAGWIPTCRPLPLLAGAYLAGVAWKAVDLAEARLQVADLSHSDLTAAALSKALAQRANFRGSLLHRASLFEMHAEGADFEGAVLTSAIADGAIFLDARLNGANLTDACLRRADFRRAILSDARSRNVNLAEANLVGAAIRRRRFFVGQSTGRLPQPLASQQGQVRRSAVPARATRRVRS